MHFSVRLVHKDVEDQDVLRCEKTSSHFISPYDVEIDRNSCHDTKSYNEALPKGWFDFQNHVSDPKNDKEKLHLTWWEPSPVIASLIGDRRVGEEVDCHCEDGPPVLVAIRVPFFVGEPAWTTAKVRANLPAEQKYQVVNGG